MLCSIVPYDDIWFTISNTVSYVNPRTYIAQCGSIYFILACHDANNFNKPFYTLDECRNMKLGVMYFTGIYFDLPDFNI